MISTGGSFYGGYPDKRDTLLAAIADDDARDADERAEIEDWNFRRRRALLDGEDFDES